MQFIVGTHALFQDQVVFNNLTLIIIDEQHRFGVHQRLSLRGKGCDWRLLSSPANHDRNTNPQNVSNDCLCRS